MIKYFEFPFIIISFSDDLDILRDCQNYKANDYMVKPINESELLFRIEKAINQYNKKTSSNDIITNDLTHIELKIFQILSHQHGSAVSKDRIFSNVWNNIHVSEKSLNVHIYNIRKKIKKFGYSIGYIQPDGYILLSDGVNPSQLRN